MNDNRDDYEPIIAERPVREPPREEGQPLWRLVLALAVGVAIVVALAWWWKERAASDGGSTTIQSESPAPSDLEVVPGVENEPPVSLDLDTGTSSDAVRDSEEVPEIPIPADEQPAPSDEQVAGPAAGDVPVAAPEGSEAVFPEVTAVPEPPAPLSVRFVSPDPQVQIELQPLDSSAPLTSRAGELVTVAPGTYRLVASGAQLETLEQEITIDGEGPLEYALELCAERKYERESLAGQVIEERVCTSTAECESAFLILSEYADQLIKDPDFRAQQCAKWRSEAAPDGRWTLDTQCGGPTLATTCRIQITEGACTSAQPRRSLRGSACPRVELE